MKSIMQDLTDPRCYICGRRTELELHHCIPGNPGRKHSDEDGLVVWLCRYCHQGIHDSGLHYEAMKIAAQTAWMKHYNKGVTEWRERYGKNYLEVDE